MRLSPAAILGVSREGHGHIVAVRAAHGGEALWVSPPRRELGLRRQRDLALHHLVPMGRWGEGEGAEKATASEGRHEGRTAKKKKGE